MGRSSPSRLPERTHVFKSLLNAAEVGRILADRRRDENGQHDDLLTIRQAERALGTTTYTIRALFDHGLLKSEDRRNLLSGRVSVGVSQSEIDKFSNRYASLSQIARASKRDRASMKIRLDDLGIHPVFEPTGFIARFYERAKIEAAGLPLDRQLTTLYASKKGSPRRALFCCLKRPPMAWDKTRGDFDPNLLKVDKKDQQIQCCFSLLGTNLERFVTLA